MIRRDMIRPAIETPWKFPLSGSYSAAIRAAVAVTSYLAAG